MNEPWVIFEDDDLLVVSKPAGVNTHRADVHAQEGMHEWVQRQRGEDLSVLHRLDKATSGVLVFGKSTRANQSLTQQFTERSVAKTYVLLVPNGRDRPAVATCDKPVRGTGVDRIVAKSASTEFRRVGQSAACTQYEATPHSGRTHQVRVHAAALGMPIVGDVEHGGPGAPRVYLHASELVCLHPDGSSQRFHAPTPASFADALAGGSDTAHASARVAAVARAGLFEPTVTDAYVCIDRHHDGFPGVQVSRLAGVAHILDYREIGGDLPDGWVDAIASLDFVESVYHQPRPRKGPSPEGRFVGDIGETRFTVREAGLRYQIDLAASTTSTGLFLDQRETRRELATADLSGKTVLNTFAHTGSLSVAAASAGAETLTLDLSKHYLDWARENLALNDHDPADHDFVFGDALDWMNRFAKRGRQFDVVLVDPPSSSTTKKSKRWVVDRDLDDLIATAARLCSPGGRIYVSTNLRRMRWQSFLSLIEAGLDQARRVGAMQTRTVPIDHRSGPGDEPYLKGAWIDLDVG